MNLTIFNQKFEEFKMFIAEKDGKFFSFDSQPYIKRHESYKDKVNAIGNEHLNINSWNRNDIGTGRILKSVRDAVDVESNNLLIHDNRRGLDARSDKSLNIEYDVDSLTEFESILFDFYNNNVTDEDSFTNLLKYTGKKYPFLAYLFFLKSKKKYLPIAPRTFDEVFKLLEIKLRTTQKCSLKNYLNYIGEIRNVQNLLQTKSELVGEEITLLDAHSYLWILGSHMKDWKPNGINTITKNPIFIELSPEKREVKNQAILEPPIGSKVDFIKDQIRKNNLGFLAEEIVLNYERSVGSVVINVSDNIALGYDIEVRNLADNIIKRIEVKTESFDKSFIITSNEISQSRKYDNYYIYVVRDVKSSQPKIQAMKVVDILNELSCYPTGYRVYF